MRRISDRDRIYSVFRSTSLQTQSAVPPESKTSSSSSSPSESDQKISGGVRARLIQPPPSTPCSASLPLCLPACLLACSGHRRLLLFVLFVSSRCTVPRDLRSSLRSNATISRPLSAAATNSVSECVC